MTFVALTILNSYSHAVLIFEGLQCSCRRYIYLELGSHVRVLSARQELRDLCKMQALCVRSPAIQHPYPDLIMPEVSVVVLEIRLFKSGCH